jgi:hypothetical protein
LKRLFFIKIVIHGNKSSSGETQQAARMSLENAGHLSPVSSVLGLGGAFQKGLVFLLNLAWNSRFRLPVLITVGFMVLDVRMQLEINVDIEVRHVHIQDDDDGEEDDDDDDDDYGDDDDDDEDSNVSGTSHISGVENEVEEEAKLEENITI